VPHPLGQDARRAVIQPRRGVPIGEARGARLRRRCGSLANVGNSTVRRACSAILLHAWAGAGRSSHGSCSCLALSCLTGGVAVSPDRRSSGTDRGRARVAICRRVKICDIRWRAVDALVHLLAIRLAVVAGRSPQVVLLDLVRLGVCLPRVGPVVHDKVVAIVPAIFEAKAADLVLLAVGCDGVAPW
jgi:hypothetical protein